MRRARLVYSVPNHVIEASIKRVAQAAIKFGIALPETLRRQAVELGATPDLKTMISDQLREFAARVKETSCDLNAEQIASNWRLLMEAASECDLKVEPSIRLAADDAQGAAAQNVSPPDSPPTAEFIPDKSSAVSQANAAITPKPSEKN